MKKATILTGLFVVCVYGFDLGRTMNRLCAGHSRAFHVMTKLTCSLIVCIVSLLAPSARGEHLVLPDQVVVGLIRDQWLAICGSPGKCGPDGPMGKPLTEERDIPGGDGRYSEFENGQIAWSPAQKMVLAGYRAPDGVHVRWKITDQYNYDFFLVRWNRDEHHEECGGWFSSSEPKSCYQQEVKGSRVSGEYVIPGDVGLGHYEITVEGCDKGGFLAPSKCRQGWAQSVRVTAGFHDVTHSAAGPSRALRPAETAAQANAVRRDRMIVSARAICANGLGDEMTEALGDVAHARLELSSDPASECGKGVRLQEVSRAIISAAIRSKVGTSIGAGQGAGLGALQGAGAGALGGFAVGCLFGPLGCLVGAGVGAVGGAAAGAGIGAAACSRDGDYDMALMSLMPVAFKYWNQLDPQARTRFVQDILTETGGSSEVRTEFHCALITIPETENHILMTETARYLANQIHWEGIRAQPQLYPTGSPEYERARRKYDNQSNGMENWMLQHLQRFLREDFHEYNARPYARLSMRALHNLADYDKSPSRRVGTAATMVLDYLSAKFAASSQDLRRAAPFRRRAENANFDAFFGHQSDEETWHFLAIAGNTRAFETLHFGRADWGAMGQMMFAGSSAYKPPDLILDLITDDSEDFSHRTFDAAPIDRRPNQTYVQAFHHEGAEIYASEREFLISGGGAWRPSGRQDEVLGFSTGDTEGQAFATFLIPRGQGNSRNELVRIAGDRDRKDRHNLCVTSGFACGLNPYVPEILYRRFAKSAGPCQKTTRGLIGQEWNAQGGAAGWLGCPLTDEIESTEGNGVYQQFERGTIAWSRPQKLVILAQYSKSTNGAWLKWHITDQYNYDFFIVRWDRDGSNVGQHDVDSKDPNATRTSGNWTVPMDRAGNYRIVIEGCDSRFLSSSKCRQGWSIPINLSFPSPAACAQVRGSWTFVNGSVSCGSQTGPGYYAAIYSAACASGSTCNGQNFGFFEVVSVPDIGSPLLTGPALSFQQFMDDVLQRNGSRNYSANGRNVYVRRGGKEVEFTPAQSVSSNVSGILAGDPDVPASLDQWKLAKGNLIESDARGCVIVRNRVMGKALVLNMHNAANPQRRETDWQPGRGLSCDNVDFPFGPDTCKQGFVWREAFEGDHVCVTPETRSQAAADNAQAPRRRSPTGGDFGPDTCLQGFVWREARPSDHVCVTPEVRQQTVDDNALATTRRVVP